MRLNIHSKYEYFKFGTDRRKSDSLAALAMECGVYGDEFSVYFELSSPQRTIESATTDIPIHSKTSITFGMRDQ